MILVIGASGNIGGRVARLTQARTVPSGTADAGAAMAGVDAVFVVGAGAGVVARDEMVAKAARDARVRRIVKLSSLDVARPDGNSLAAWHARGEDAIRASGVPWTFVRPCGFMSNALAWADALRATGEVRASTGEGKVAMIHPDDIAEVVVAALDTRFEREVLEITGPEPLDYATMVRTIAEEAGLSRAVFVPISDAEARERILAIGKPPPVAEALVGLWRAVREGKVATVTNTVERVLGKPPRPFRQWARENAAAFSLTERTERTERDSRTEA